jgi:hypothetical protein
VPASTEYETKVCLQCRKVLPIGSKPHLGVYCSEPCEEQRRIDHGPAADRVRYLRIQERRARRRERLEINPRGD